MILFSTLVTTSIEYSRSKRHFVGLINPLENTEDYCRKSWVGETNYIDTAVSSVRNIFVFYFELRLTIFIIRKLTFCETGTMFILQSLERSEIFSEQLFTFVIISQSSTSATNWQLLLSTGIRHSMELQSEGLAKRRCTL